MRTIVLIALSCLLAGIVLAAEPTSTTQRPNLVAMSDAEAALLSPMHQRIRTVLLEGQAEQAAIEAERRAAEDPMAIKALDQRLVRSREATEMAIYTIQAEFARQEGREADALHFERMVAAMKKPAVVDDVPAVAPREEVSR